MKTVYRKVLATDNFAACVQEVREALDTQFSTYDKRNSVTWFALDEGDVKLAFEIARKHKFEVVVGTALGRGNYVTINRFNSV